MRNILPKTKPSTHRRLKIGTPRTYEDDGSSSPTYPAVSPGEPKRRGLDPDGQSYSTRSSLTIRHHSTSSSEDQRGTRASTNEVEQPKEEPSRGGTPRIARRHFSPTRAALEKGSVSTLAQLIWQRKWEAAEDHLTTAEASKETWLPCFPLGGSTGLPLHLACTMRPLPPASFLQQLLLAFPEACLIRQRTWGLLPLHLASDLSLHNNKTAGSKVPRRPPSRKRRTNDSVSSRLLLLNSNKEKSMERSDDTRDDDDDDDDDAPEDEKLLHHQASLSLTSEDDPSSSEAGNHVRIVRLLLQGYPESIYAREDTNGMLPLHIAASTARSENGVVSPTSATVIQVLAQSAPSTLEMVDGYGDTPVALAWREALFGCYQCGHAGNLPCLCQNKVAVATRYLHPLLREDVGTVLSHSKRSTLVHKKSQSSDVPQHSTSNNHAQTSREIANEYEIREDRSSDRRDRSVPAEQEEDKASLATTNIALPTTTNKLQQKSSPARMEEVRSTGGEQELTKPTKQEYQKEEPSYILSVHDLWEEEDEQSRPATAVNSVPRRENSKTKVMSYSQVCGSSQHSRGGAVMDMELPRQTTPPAAMAEMLEQSYRLEAPSPTLTYLPDKLLSTGMTSVPRRKSNKTKTMLYSQACESSSQHSRGAAAMDTLPRLTAAPPVTTETLQEYDRVESNHSRRPDVDETGTKKPTLSPSPRSTTASEILENLQQGLNDPSLLLDRGRDPAILQPPLVERHPEAPKEDRDDICHPPFFIHGEDDSHEYSTVDPPGESTGMHWGLLMCRSRAGGRDDDRRNNEKMSQPLGTTISIPISYSQSSTSTATVNSSRPLLRTRGMTFDFRSHEELASSPEAKVEKYTSMRSTHLERIPEQDEPRTPSTTTRNASPTILSRSSTPPSPPPPTTTTPVVRFLQSVKILRIQLQLSELRRPMSSKHPKRPPNPYYEICISNGHSVAARYHSYPLMGTRAGVWDEALIDVTSNGNGSPKKTLSNECSTSEDAESSATTDTSVVSPPTMSDANWQIGIRVLHHKPSSTAARSGEDSIPNNLIGECRTSLHQLQKQPQQPLHGGPKGFQVMGWLEVRHLSLVA